MPLSQSIGKLLCRGSLLRETAYLGGAAADQTAAKGEGRKFMRNCAVEMKQSGIRGRRCISDAVSSLLEPVSSFSKLKLKK